MGHPDQREKRLNEINGTKVTYGTINVIFIPSYYHSYVTLIFIIMLFKVVIEMRHL